MKRKNKAYWVERMNNARKMWAALRPGETPAGRRPTAVGFQFATKRRVVPGVQWGVIITAFSGYWCDDKDWTFGAKIWLYDREVAALTSHAVGRDRSKHSFVSFSVLYAADLLAGGNGSPRSREFDFEVTNDTVRRRLSADSRQIDRLWRFAGGQDMAGFRKLAVWSMRNAKVVGTSWTNPHMICAAWAYGEPRLAKSLLKAYEEQWKEKLRTEPGYRRLPDFRLNLLGELDRLRGMMRMRAKNPAALGWR